jgi:lysozyme family protein
MCGDNRGSASCKRDDGVMSFDKAFELTIGHEGGYVNDKDDRGGETNWGISKRSYPDEDIKNLTIERAKEIYKKDYWERQSLHLVDDANIAIEIFDTSVNMGVGKGGKIFQEALNLTNRNERDYANIVVDGAIGAKTISAYRKCKNKKLLFNLLNFLQAEFYIELMRKREVNEKFIGWFNRVIITK